MKGNRVIVIAVLMLAGLSSAPLAAQGLLPSSVGTWTSSGTSTQVSAQQMEQLASDRAAILREYGVGSGERRDYTSGNDKITVTLFRMVDPSAAYGAFTFFREPDMASPAPIPYASYVASRRGRTLLVVGELVLDVNADKSQIAPADLNALAKGVGAQADRRPYPPIATFLPHGGLIPGSEQYVLGPLALAKVFPPAAANQTDWAGFSSSAEAIVGRYRLQDKASGGRQPAEALLLLVLYPTQQLAADRYNALSKLFALNVEPGEAGGKPAVFGTRSSALIGLLANVNSRETAATLLNQVHYASQVTWDEPTHKLTDPTISTIVVGAIVDTGAVMLLALAASLGFGGFRILAKFIAPGKIFDRNTEVEILQLGISSKPIDVKDFYVLQSPK
jgi:hypothetical protein